MPLTPEDKAREVIDDMLEKAGWHVCDIKDANIHAFLLPEKLTQKSKPVLNVLSVCGSRY